MITLIKPAIEHNTKERAKIYHDLIKANRRKYAIDGRLTGQQAAAAKGNAWKEMKKAGF